MEDAPGGRGWAAVELSAVPGVPTSEPGDLDWKALQHVLGLTAFGLNAYVAETAGVVLVEEHDERASGQEEAYIVVEGRVLFTLDGEPLELGAGGVVAVRDPAVRRRAEAREPGATLLGVGCAPGSFETSWRPEHFGGLARHPAVQD